MQLMLLAGLACTGCSTGTIGTMVLDWYLVAASAAGGVPYCDLSSINLSMLHL
jgi:hypothetical protein